MVLLENYDVIIKVIEKGQREDQETKIIERIKPETYIRISNLILGKTESPRTLNFLLCMIIGIHS